MFNNLRNEAIQDTVLNILHIRRLVKTPEGGHVWSYDSRKKYLLLLETVGEAMPVDDIGKLQLVRSILAAAFGLGGPLLS